MSALVRRWPRIMVDDEGPSGDPANSPPHRACTSPTLVIHNTNADPRTVSHRTVSTKYGENKRCRCAVFAYSFVMIRQVLLYFTSTDSNLLGKKNWIFVCTQYLRHNIEVLHLRLTLTPYLKPFIKFQASHGSLLSYPTSGDMQYIYAVQVNRTILVLSTTQTVTWNQMTWSPPQYRFCFFSMPQ